MTRTVPGKKTTSATPKAAAAASNGSRARRSGVGATKPASEAEVERLTQSLKVKEDEAPWTAEELRAVGKYLREEIESYEREIERAEEELANFIQSSSDGGGEDQADAGAKTFERDHEIALANNSRDMLRQTERALEQLRAGTYGICENCGNPIGKGRLQVFPRATLCMPCKTKQERH
jgi:RNA polymerase-binding protein DksA